MCFTVCTSESTIYLQQQHITNKQKYAKLCREIESTCYTYNALQQCHRINAEHVKSQSINMHLKRSLNSLAFSFNYCLLNGNLMYNYTHAA